MNGFAEGEFSAGKNLLDASAKAKEQVVEPLIVAANAATDLLAN